MRRTILCLFAAASLAAVSCKKDKDKDNGEPAAGDKFLVKVTETTHGMEGISTLTWNAQNKLTGNKMPGETEQQFIYDNAGRLSKYISIDEEINLTETYEFTYTATGLPQRYKLTSLLEGGEPVISEGNYVLNAGKVTRIIEKNGETLEETIVDFQYTGSNVTQLHSASPDGFEAKITITYGSKKNPLTAARMPYVLLPDFALEGFSQNEALTIRTESDVFDMNSTLTYEYDPAGYPLKSTLKEDGVAKTVSVYTYR